MAPAKTGPDYIDPAFLAAAAGAPAINLDPWAMPPAMLRGLVDLSGDIEVLERAHVLLKGAPEHIVMALDELTEIARVMALRYPSVPLYFDLAELRGYHYHTGVTFAAFIPGTGQSIAQGGRYDDIGRDFGRARPATGFSTDLRLLVAWGEIDADSRNHGIWAPHGDQPGLLDRVTELRAAGERVIMALPGQLETDAASLGCDRILRHANNGWQVDELQV